MEKLNADRKYVSLMSTCAIVYIEENENGIPSGRIINHWLEKPLCFHGMGDFVIKMEELYDALELPKPDNIPFSFLGGEKKQKNKIKLCTEPDDSWEKTWLSRESYVARFVIHTRYRYHSSWQGTISWPEESVEMAYNSALDCIRLMMEALSK